MTIEQSKPRQEDDRLLRGAGCFTADVAQNPGRDLAMVVVRSSVAAGHIDRIDTGDAADMPGIVAILTAADLETDGVGQFEPRMIHPGPDGGGMAIPPFPPLAQGAVHFVGEPVAVVFAETQDQAEAAADAVVLDIADLPAVTDVLEALAPGSPRVWDHLPHNHCFRVEKGDRPAVEAALQSAPHVIRQRLRISRVTAAPLEPRAARAEFDAASGRYLLRIGTQSPHRVRADIAAVLGIPSDRLRLIAQDCGGSFGMKNVAFPEYVLALWGARRLRRPVTWQAGRLESFMADAHARDQWVDAALALDAGGRFLALDVHIRANLGACLGPSTTHPPVANIGGLAGVYRTPHLAVTVDGVLTNTQQTAPYRGAGRPEATYVIERMVDLAAAALGLDRADLRRRNMIAPAEMPYRTGLTFTYDSGDFPGVLDRALALADWQGFAARRAQSAGRGQLRGIGIANPIEIAGGPQGKPHAEFAGLVLSPDGRAQLTVGSFDTGQGHGTVFRQLLADRLGLAAEKIRLVSGDTDLVARGTGSFGSRTLSAAGAAILVVVDRVIGDMKPAAAEMLEAAPADIEFADAGFRIAGTDRHLPFADVLATLTDPVGAETFASAQDATFPNGCHICEVEIDPETGQVRVERYVVVDDVGTVMNPMLVKGQIAGGVVQGLGQALGETMSYDPETGQLVTASFMDYVMPRAADLPLIEVHSHPVPTIANPLGVKGAGEAGTVGALAAVASAIGDALSSRGIRHLDMPATPVRVWQALQEVRLLDSCTGSLKDDDPRFGLKETACGVSSSA